MFQARSACFGFCLAALGVPASSGPWPREAGRHFVTLSVEQDRQSNRYEGLYGEYGLTPRTTLGYEIGHANAGEISGLIWLQRAWDAGGGANRMAMSAGIGAVHRDGQTLPVAQVGSSWGRGFEGFWKGGWITAEMRVRIAGRFDDPALPGLSAGSLAYLTPDMTTKAEVTLGLRRTDSLMLINQLRIEKRQDEDISTRLASSMVRDLSGYAKLELGIITPLSGVGEQAVRIGTWLEF